METKKFNVVPAQSNIEWVGRKVTGAHNGTIAVKQGELIFEGGKLSGGKLVVDTTSIKVLDVTDPATNAQFSGHLASDDFFSSAQHPEATLTIRSVVGYQVNADLTIKGITHPIAFNTVFHVDTNGTLNANAKVVVDRTKYDMKFRSGNFFMNLGDTLIYNDFDLAVSLTAIPVHETTAAI